jgi:hypothetical protein
MAAMVSPTNVPAQSEGANSSNDEVECVDERTFQQLLDERQKRAKVVDLCKSPHVTEMVDLTSPTSPLTSECVVVSDQHASADLELVLNSEVENLDGGSSLAVDERLAVQERGVTDNDAAEDNQEPTVPQSGLGGGGGGKTDDSNDDENKDGDSRDGSLFDALESSSLFSNANAAEDALDATAVASIRAFEPPLGFAIDTAQNEKSVIGRKVAVKWDGAPLDAKDFGWHIGTVIRRMKKLEMEKNPDCQFWVQYSNKETNGVLPAGVGTKGKNAKAYIAHGLLPAQRTATGAVKEAGVDMRWVLLARKVTN